MILSKKKYLAPCNSIMNETAFYQVSNSIMVLMFFVCFCSIAVIFTALCNESATWLMVLIQVLRVLYFSAKYLIVQESLVSADTHV